MNTFDKINYFLLFEILGNKIYTIFLAVIIFFVIYFGLRFIVKIIKRSIRNYTKNKKEEIFLVMFLNTIRDLPRWFFLTIEIYVPIMILNLSEDLKFAINLLFLSVIILQVIKIISKVLIFSLSNFFKSKNDKEDKTAQKTIEMIVNIVVWVIGILMFLTNIGINLTPLVASLGVASVAVAFALQNILRDLFSSFSIIISKPFNVGDFIIVGEGSSEMIGTVRDITLKSTYLSNLLGHEVVIPNSKILDTEIINYSKMNHRRKRFKIGLIYETSSVNIRRIPKIIEEVISKVDSVKYERCYLTELNSYSIDYMISYDISETDYTISLGIQEKILIGIIEKFEKEGIHIAYPTQVLHTPNIKN